MNRTILCLLLQIFASAAVKAEPRIDALQQAQITRATAGQWRTIAWEGSFKSPTSTSDAACRVHQGLIEFSGMISDSQGGIRYGAARYVLPDDCRPSVKQIMAIPAMISGNRLIHVVIEAYPDGTFQFIGGSNDNGNFYGLYLNGASMRKS